MAACASCGAENRSGAKFCGACGLPMVVLCSACGSPVDPQRRFCDECGTAVLPSVGTTTVPPDAITPASERRLVSVVFIDLVGFTSASDGRDAEDTRELLTRYFEFSRRTIERYGGTVEKFIGDAVMAVWGAPTAKEDDAERAVRAALELVGSVAGLDPDLRARGGVLTGEAAVTVGARGQGMVAGDLVNTASRIQSIAAPGTVLVGDATKYAAEGAVAYDDAGEHTLKGKPLPVHLWRALRVVAGVKGALRSSGLEAPFVGRDRELRLVKELLHGSTDESRAQLALVTGIAGIGKSRLAWEFEKYVDGLADDIFWHRGRCLSYGEGVAYWALAEMVRMRCRIVEDEEPESARTKLRRTLEQSIPDPDELAWVEPRLAHLLGLEEGAPGDQENLFSAWRILFERLAEQSPTVLLFEDLQWADNGLLDFIEYLLDWSRGHALFVLALARPEFAERRPGWGAGKRSFSSLYLEPLSPTAMVDLLDGLVPGLSDDLRDRILARAEGVPLYAVETVRMLLDRGLLTREGSAYRASGDIDRLEVPDTLHALVAARLDALPFEERRLVECGAVLGKTFTKQGLAAVSGLVEAKLEPLLVGLLGKEILSVQADPRSPERGQYSFLQDIVKRVAYETISKRERKTKHLAAAQFLASVWSAEEDETVELVAAHYLDAFHSAPDDEDAGELKARAFEMLVRAADRAASLGASAEAQRALERAAELTDSELVRAEMLERAGTMAYIGGRTEEAAASFERAIQLFESAGETHPAARVAARVAEISWDRGRLEQGLESMDRAFAMLSEEEPDADLAGLAAQVGRFMYFAGQQELALNRLDRALEIAERLALPETLAHALNSKGIVLVSMGRQVEGMALLRTALATALQHDRPSASLRAYYNLADITSMSDGALEAAQLMRDGLALARKVGNRYWEWAFVGDAYPSYVLGDWDDVIAREDQLPKDDWMQVRIAFTTLLTSLLPVLLHRGQVVQANELMTRFAVLESSADVQERAQVNLAKAHVLLAEGNYTAALLSAAAAIETRHAIGIGYEAVKEAFPVALDAALAVGDTARAEEFLGLVDDLPAGESRPFLTAQAGRFRARLAAQGGDADEANLLFSASADRIRELGYPFFLAVVLLEHGEWLASSDQPAASKSRLVEARALFETLRAEPWLQRTDLALAVRPAQGQGSGSV